MYNEYPTYSTDTYIYIYHYSTYGMHVVHAAVRRTVPPPHIRQGIHAKLQDVGI